MKNVFLTGALLALMAVLAGCASMQLVSLDTVEGPQEVGQGQIINPSDITVWGTYKDESRKPVAIKADNIIFDSSSPGPQPVRVRVSGQEARFQTEVLPVTGVELERPPTKTSYEAGQPLNLAGIALYGTYAGANLRRGLIEENHITASGYDVNSLGQQQVTVTAGGHSTTFTITVTVAISGSWVAGDGQPPADRLTFRDGQYSRLNGLTGRSSGSGTYTIDGNNLIMQSTAGVVGSRIHEKLPPGVTFVRETVRPALALYQVPEDEIPAALARFDAIMQPRTVPFSVSGNTLTLGDETFTRMRSD